MIIWGLNSLKVMKLFDTSVKKQKISFVQNYDQSQSFMDIFTAHLHIILVPTLTLMLPVHDLLPPN